MRAIRRHRFAEHVALDESSPWYAEHLARYRYAARLPGARRVLDVACGPGIGFAELAATHIAVLGVELDPSALLDATAPAQRHGVRLCRADGGRLPFPDQTFDLITSFETVEHIAGDLAFVTELRRVASADATVLVSTPNALVTHPVDGVPRNPFHVREYTPDQFAALLRTSFEDVEILGQIPTGSFAGCNFWVPGDDVGARLRRASLKVSLRLPPQCVRALERTRGRTLFPGPEDFDLSSTAIARAHALMAVCTRPRAIR